MSYNEESIAQFYAFMSFSSADPRLEKAMQDREKKYGYRRGSNASFTKPGEYKNIPESSFADPVGYNYPIDDTHVWAAVTYWSHMDHRKAYGPPARKFITERIIRAALAKGIKVSWQSDDPDYRNLPEPLKKRMEGYGDTKKSFLEDPERFRAYCFETMRKR